MTVEDYIERTSMVLATVAWLVALVMFFAVTSITSVQQAAILFFLGAGTWVGLYACFWVFFKIISKLSKR